MDKPEPIIEKIEFTPEQLQDIKEIIEGKPSQELKDRWKQRGVTPKYYLPASFKNRPANIRKMYFKGLSLCRTCHQLPEYRVLYKLPDATLIEYWCEKHLPNII